MWHSQQEFSFFMSFVRLRNSLEPSLLVQRPRPLILRLKPHTFTYHTRTHTLTHTHTRAAPQQHTHPDK